MKLLQTVNGIQFTEQILKQIFLAATEAAWHGTTPHYMKMCIRNCNASAESERMQDNFHHEYLDKKLHISIISVVVTIVTITSAIFFLYIQLKLYQRNQSSTQRRQLH